MGCVVQFAAGEAGSSTGEAGTVPIKGHFRNSSILKLRAIRSFHEQRNIRLDDIKYLASNGALVTISPNHTYSFVQINLSQIDLTQIDLNKT